METETRIFKTEMHCHTRTVSPCANGVPADMVETYVQKGYTTVVVTDHFKRWVVEHPAEIAYLPGHTRYLPSDMDLSVFEKDPKDLTWADKVHYFTAGYRYFKELAAGRINVLLGAELTPDEMRRNDYLLYGVTEQFLLDNPELFSRHIWEIHDACREAGVLLVQAHPFRDGLMVTPPQHLDGMEIYNGTPGEDQRNFAAKQWAAHYGLIPTSGSDWHGTRYTPDAGIRTAAPVTDVDQLTAVLRSGRYDLIRDLPGDPF